MSTIARNLKLHKESKHEGIRHHCDQSDYAATQATALKRHKETMHDCVRYPCGQGENAATTAFYLAM